ncbi:MAG TPA: hypothetical protein VJU61_07795 [Polyangiaceae bacterium]|nr:hypothetical protein [Polyangiaceae bacterium]
MKRRPHPWRQPRSLSCGGLLALVLGLTHCGATPMPEPPSLDGGSIGVAPVSIAVLSEPRLLPIEGQAGAATPGALVQVINLETRDAAVSTTAASDGSFLLSVPVRSGDELRLQAQTEGARSEPIDLLYRSVELVETLEPSPRHDCVVLEPGFELHFSGSVQRGLRVRNACSGPIELANPRFRLAAADFGLDTALPRTLTPGSDALLELTLRNATPPAREDVLFVDISLAGQVLRYPIGLYAPED